MRATALHASAGVRLLAAAHRISADWDAARMEPSHRAAVAVTIDELDSPFLSGFASAELAPSYLVRDVDVTWSPASASLPRAGRVATGTA